MIRWVYNQRCEKREFLILMLYWKGHLASLFKIKSQWLKIYKIFTSYDFNGLQACK